MRDNSMLKKTIFSQAVRCPYCVDNDYNGEGRVAAALLRTVPLRPGTR